MAVLILADLTDRTDLAAFFAEQRKIFGLPSLHGHTAPVTSSMPPRPLQDLERLEGPFLPGG